MRAELLNHDFHLPFVLLSARLATLPRYLNLPSALSGDCRRVMGGCASKPVDLEAKARSDDIDKMIEEDGKRLKKECKILLLGACPAPAQEPQLTASQAPASPASRPSSSK